ncbi:hypothetical protein GCK32_020028 [Trichostrongylus colubriformis]|uniref:Uncharacterized protein n=1 Tax=Trichostrongylus colubriformis TaxID=6319 RepID=A0AAN8FUY6_TRICO
MSTKDDEEDVFEIDDFTVITEFEHFVVAIEGFLKSCSWQFKSATLSFGESNKLKATYCYPDVASEPKQLASDGDKNFHVVTETRIVSLTITTPMVCDC